MASDDLMQAIGRLERALARAEGLARDIVEEHALATAAAAETPSHEEAPEEPAVEQDPFSREKAIAALKSLDALIGDLQKARSEA